MTQTDDGADFVARLNAAEVRRGGPNFTTEAPWEPWETDSSGMATYRVVMIPRKPSTIQAAGHEGARAMSKGSTKAAFQKAFSAHMLLNLTEEEQEGLSTSPRYPTYDERIRQLQRQRSARWKARVELFKPARGG
jgi:hypothetical protein